MQASRHHLTLWCFQRGQWALYCWFAQAVSVSPSTGSLADAVIRYYDDQLGSPEWWQDSLPQHCRREWQRRRSRRMAAASECGGVGVHKGWIDKRLLIDKAQIGPQNKSQINSRSTRNRGQNDNDNKTTANRQQNDNKATTNRQQNDSNLTIKGQLAKTTEKH